MKEPRTDLPSPSDSTELAEVLRRDRPSCSSVVRFFVVGPLIRSTRGRDFSMSKVHDDHKRSKDAAVPMAFEAFSFGSIRINGTSYDHDVVIDRGRIRKRDKKPSKKFRDDFGHTPLSAEEEIPWKCHRLVVGTGGGALPVMKEVKQEARRREIELVIVPTEEAIRILEEDLGDTNAILHVTC
jgi:hypothetical protein